jgi:PilX N-terminal
MKRPRSYRKSEKGIALFLSVLLLLVITVMGVALMFTASLEQTLTATETKISKIFYAADSGIEYAGGMLASSINYAGGPMPVGISSYYPGSPTADMTVTIAPPVLLGWADLIGYGAPSEGEAYGSPKFVENLYYLNSSARSTKIEASKTIEAEIGVSPKLLEIPE